MRKNYTLEKNIVETKYELRCSKSYCFLIDFELNIDFVHCVLSDIRFSQFSGGDYSAVF